MGIFTHGSLVGGGVSIVDGMISSSLSMAIFSIAAVVDIVDVVVVVFSLQIRSSTNSSFCSIVETLARDLLAYTHTHTDTNTNTLVSLIKSVECVLLCVSCFCVLF